MPSSPPGSAWIARISSTAARDSPKSWRHRTAAAACPTASGTSRQHGCRAMLCQHGQVALAKGSSNKSCSPLENLPTDWQHLVTSCWPQDNVQLPAAKTLHIMFVALTGIATAQDAAVCSVVQVALVWCSSQIFRNSQPALAFRHHT